MLSSETIETIKQVLKNRLYTLKQDREQNKIVYEDYQVRKEETEKALNEIENFKGQILYTKTEYLLSQNISLRNNPR